MYIFTSYTICVKLIFLKKLCIHYIKNETLCYCNMEQDIAWTKVMELNDSYNTFCTQRGKLICSGILSSHFSYWFVPYFPNWLVSEYILSSTNCFIHKHLLSCIRDVPIPKFEPIPILNFKAIPILNRNRYLDFSVLKFSVLF